MEKTQKQFTWMGLLYITSGSTVYCGVFSSFSECFLDTTLMVKITTITCIFRFFSFPLPHKIHWQMSVDTHYTEYTMDKPPCKEGLAWHLVRGSVCLFSTNDLCWTQGSNLQTFLGGVLRKVYSVQVLCSSLAFPVEYGILPTGQVRYLT